MITKKMQIQALQDQVGELQRRLRILEDNFENFSYMTRNEIKCDLNNYMKEGIGYIILKRDKEQIVAQIKDVISDALRKEIK